MKVIFYVCCPDVYGINNWLSFRDVDDVHDLMDEVAEQQEIANEISEAISSPVGFGQDVDEVCQFFWQAPLFQLLCN